MRNLILGLALTLAATVKSAQAETVNEKTARCYGYLDQANQSLTTEMHVYDNTLTPYLETWRWSTDGRTAAYLAPRKNGLFAS